MEKDIDDLLDEVESKFVNKSKNIKGGAKSQTPHPQNVKMISEKKVPNRSNIDEAIDDILDLDLNEGNRNKQFASESCSSAVSSHAASSDATKKCFPVFIGGSTEECGRSSTVNHRTCNRLRCTACDFRVSFFDDFTWHKDTSYLFLRNNVPDFQKLKSKLLKKKGCRAYCCQCSWRNISALSELNDPNLKWVCGKHTS